MWAKVEKTSLLLGDQLMSNELYFRWIDQTLIRVQFVINKTQKSCVEFQKCGHDFKIDISWILFNTTMINETFRKLIIYLFFTHFVSQFMRNNPGDLFTANFSLKIVTFDGNETLLQCSTSDDIMEKFHRKTSTETQTRFIKFLQQWKIGEEKDQC